MDDVLPGRSTSCINAEDDFETDLSGGSERFANRRGDASGAFEGASRPDARAVDTTVSACIIDGC